MKKVSIALAAAMVFMVLFSLTAFAEESGPDEWRVLTGGSVDDGVLYTDSIGVQTPTGIRFVGKGGFTPVEGDDIATAAAGGVFQKPIDIKDFKIDFSIQSIAGLNDSNEGGEGDSWMAFSLLAEPVYFTTEEGRGTDSITFLARFLSGGNLAVQMYNKPADGPFAFVAEQVYEGVKFDDKHTIEFKYNDAEQTYDLYFDSELYAMYQMDATDMEMFTDDTAYFQISMQYQNIKQTIPVNELSFNNFEVQSITTGGVSYEFGKEGTDADPMPVEGDYAAGGTGSYEPGTSSISEPASQPESTPAASSEAPAQTSGGGFPVWAIVLVIAAVVVVVVIVVVVVRRKKK